MRNGRIGALSLSISKLWASVEQMLFVKLTLSMLLTSSVSDSEGNWLG